MARHIEEDDIRPIGDVGRPENPRVIDNPTRLMNMKNEVSRYVRSFTRKGVPVKFSQEQGLGYTAPDGSVTITAAITEDSYPAVIGTALHEAAHVNWTDLGFFKRLAEEPEKVIPSRLWNKARQQGEDEEWIKYALKSICNSVEDRRIDSMTFDERPGWRKYLLYRYNFWYFSENTDEALQTAATEMEEEWGAYMFHVTNLHNPKIDRHALDALPDIMDTIDLEDIDRLENMRDSFEISLDVFELILDAVDEPMEDFDKCEGGQGGAGGSGGGDSEEGDQEVENVGIKGADEDLEEDFNKQLDIVHGEEEKAEIDEDTAREIEILENEDIEDVEVGGDPDSANDSDVKGGRGMIQGSGRIGKTDCRVIRKVSDDMISRSMFCFSSRARHSDAVRKGKDLGKLLAKKLKVRDEQREWKSTRKKRGRLSGALLAEVGFNENLFEQKFTEEYEDAFIHMSLDASGSMGGDKWREAMICSMAIATACDIIGSVQCQISARFTMGSSGILNSASAKPAIAIMYDSRRESYRQAKDKLPHATTGGSTPEGLCYEAIMDQILESSRNKDAYFVNFSDGMPNFSNRDVSYGSSNAFPHTARQIDKMKRHGDIEVLSYYIGGGRSNDGFREMYGNDAEFIDVTEIGPVARTLNDMLLDK